MSLLEKLKSLLGKTESAPIAPAHMPRPTSLADRRKQGLNLSVDPGLKDAQSNQDIHGFKKRSDDPYATAAWEVDPTSGRRRLKQVNPGDSNKDKGVDNPYDTSSNLDPWKRTD